MTSHDPISARLAALKTTSTPDLKAQWRDLFATEPPPFNRRYLESRLAYRIQELAYGGLKPETIRRLEQLMDFSKLVEVFDRNGVTFVSVTQSFNTTTSMGRLKLNILLSFAQFEREVTAERIRDSVRASRMKGIWIGGGVPLGYVIDNRKLVENPIDAAHVRWVFAQFIEIGSGTLLAREPAERGVTTTRGHRIDEKFIYRMLNNRVYIGEAVHKGTIYPGEHKAIIDRQIWDKVLSILTESPANAPATAGPRPRPC